MSVVIPDGNRCLEPGPLASTGLLLHGHKLQNFILEGCSQEKVNSLRLLDGQREKVDLLQGLDLHVLDQEAQLGNGEPLLVLGLASVSSAVSAPAPTPATTLAPHATTEASEEATAASHSMAPRASRPSRSTGVIRHLVFSRRSSAFFIVQLSHPYMTTEKTIALTRRTFVGKVMPLFFNMLSRLAITFLWGLGLYTCQNSATGMPMITAFHCM